MSSAQRWMLSQESASLISHTCCFPHASPSPHEGSAQQGPRVNLLDLQNNLERAKGFEPSTPTLAR